MSKLELELWHLSFGDEDESLAVGGDGEFDYHMISVQNPTTGETQYLVEPLFYDTPKGPMVFGTIEEAIKGGEKINGKYRWSSWKRELDEAMDTFRTRKRSREEVIRALKSRVRQDAGSFSRFPKIPYPSEQQREQVREQVVAKRDSTLRAIDLYEEAYGAWDGPMPPEGDLL